MMRLVLIGDGNSVHIKKWVAWYIKNGFEIILITTSDIKGNFPDVSLVRKLPDPERKRFIGQWTLVRLMNRIRTAMLVKRFRPDIVHVHRLNDYLNHFISGPPIIFNAWGSEVYQLSHGSLGERALKRNAERADLILGTTEEMVNVLHERYNIPKEVLSHFSWGLDLSLFPFCENKAVFKHENGFDTEKTLFISPRGMAPIYRNEVILDAFVMAHGKNERIHLLIIGNNLMNDTYESLRTIVEKNSLTDSVTIIGRRLELSELSPLLQASDFYIGIPMSDQLSSSLLESMACGCIPIVNDINAYRDLISHERNGLVWSSGRTEDLADLILRASKLGNEGDRWRKSNRVLIEREQDWEKQAVNLFQYYQRLLEMAPHPQMAFECKKIKVK